MEGNSFSFRGINFLEKFGIKIIKIDFILPPKRERKIHIPNRNGQYDFGATSWEERVIRIECDLLNRLNRDEVREISSILSKKGKLIFWDEEDKHYIGEIYNPPEIFEYPKAYIRTFTLEFICEPFAYSETKEIELQLGNNTIEYLGTEKTPCIIQIINKSNHTIGGHISINTTYKRR